MKCAAFLLFAFAVSVSATTFESGRHPVPREHPRLFGNLERLRALSRQRLDDYRRVVRVARQEKGEDTARMISMALVSAIEGDRELGKQVQQMAMKYVNGPIRKGHVTFGPDLAFCGIAYDLCHDSWPEPDRRKFYEYLNKTVDANAQSETHVFHNAWYGYKHWGIGTACYACYHENERAPAILRVTEQDFRTRAAPALELAGNGGGWAEGYYINYWLYEWLLFCEVARVCEGLDYPALAPQFFRNRAAAGMFEAYPGIGEYGSRRPVPIGDGGGRTFGGDRDKALFSRRMLVNHFRDDPVHRVVHAFNETTPRSGVGINAYADFLWRDPGVTRGSLENFRLSHFSPGAGYVCARSSWAEDATYFFFKCGDRFTAHQHLDVGNFLIYKHEELVGDGGHYDDFSSSHAVNYYLRTIAHNTILVRDPGERWPGIRGGQATGNDGGQHHAWPHHNGAVSDAAEWQKERKLYDIADISAFEDKGAYVYVAGDCTRAYSPEKLSLFTRQIVFVRPGTLVIFDRVKATKPGFKKTWLLQAMKPPMGSAPDLVVTNGKGKLFVRTLLPEKAEVRLVSGENINTYGGGTFPPSRKIGAAPECRIEVSPQAASEFDCFLHVLTATDDAVGSVDRAECRVAGASVLVSVGKLSMNFNLGTLGGGIDVSGRTCAFPLGITLSPTK